MKGIITKNDKAVSPIIATILLIAITVVLAATLVTILGGFTHGASGTAATASVSTKFASNSTVSSSPIPGSTSVYVNVSAFSATNVSSSKISFTLTVTISSTTYTYTGNLGTTSLTNTTSGAGSTGDFTLNTHPAYFTAGSDYVFKGPQASVTSVTLQLVYSGSVIYSS